METSTVSLENEEKVCLCVGLKTKFQFLDYKQKAIFLDESTITFDSVIQIQELQESVL